jgi:hypothetical protein
VAASKAKIMNRPIIPERNVVGADIMVALYLFLISLINILLIV